MQTAPQILTELQDLLAQGKDSDTLLRYAVSAIKASSPAFDWVGVYLLTDDGSELWLHNYEGTPTDHVRIPVGRGVCGTAIAENANQNVPDVRLIENYISCSPTVRSELVVLIRSGDTLFGQFDLDSETVGVFTDADEAGIQILADLIGARMAEERGKSHG